MKNLMKFEYITLTDMKIDLRVQNMIFAPSVPFSHNIVYSLYSYLPRKHNIISIPFSHSLGKLEIVLTY